jgi:cation transport regulator ChaB
MSAYRTGEQLAGYRNWCARVDARDNAQRRTRGLRQEVASSIAWSVMHWE